MFEEEKELIKLLKKIAVGIFIGIFLVPFILTRKNIFEIDYIGTGAIGDTFGGITAPFIGGIGVLLTFAAFYVQYKANIEQRKSLKEQQKQLGEQRTQNMEQEKDLKIERFENRFFELIKIHRENVAEISLVDEGITSKKAFIVMFDEYRACYYVLRDYLLHNITDINKEEIVNIAFIFFYIGIDENSNILIYELLKKYDRETIKIMLDELSNRRNQSYYMGNYGLNFTSLEELPKFSTSLSYAPFQGHVSRLGNYFRHIWMMINFLDNQDSEIFPDDVKKEYAKMFRAQISNYEQLIIHYNALTDLGKVWFERKLITKYKLTKNLPYPMAYFGPNLEVLYGKGYFEWEEALKND